MAFWQNIPRMGVLAQVVVEKIIGWGRHGGREILDCSTVSHKSEHRIFGVSAEPEGNKLASEIGTYLPIN